MMRNFSEMLIIIDFVEYMNIFEFILFIFIIN